MSDSIEGQTDNALIGDTAAADNDGTVDVEQTPNELEDENQTETEKGNDMARIPLGRVRKIMKADPALAIANQDSVFIIAKATELFIESLAVEAYQCMAGSKKKTLGKKDVDLAIEKIDALAFLDGALDE